MTATIQHPRDRVSVVRDTPCPQRGYLLFAAAIAPPRGPLVAEVAERQRVLEGLARRLDDVRQLESVVRATAFRAILLPPGRPPRWQPELQLPRFDVAALIETRSPEDLAAAGDSFTVTTIRNLMGSASTTFNWSATCIRTLADVEPRSDGVYLFNFWAARDREVAVQVWEHLALWYRAKTRLQSSTVLAPSKPDDLTFVNYARWDSNPFALAARQLFRPSFYTFVRKNLRANDIQMFPALYRAVEPSTRSRRSSSDDFAGVHSSHST